MTRLQDVAQAASDAAAAQAELRRAIRRAYEEDASISDLARAAAVGRQTIYRWLTLDDPAQPVPPATAINDALTLMATLVEPYDADQIRRRMGGSQVSQLLALRIGRKGISQETYASLTDEERDILALATEAENRLNAARTNT